jgi:hypothetical protein
MLSQPIASRPMATVLPLATTNVFEDDDTPQVLALSPIKLAKMPSAVKTSSDDKAKTHKLSLRGSSKLVTEFFEYSINTILFQRGVYPAEDFSA